FAEKYDDGKNQKYKYNGKELDDMHQLNLYDYSARYYESAVGRFTSVDPLAEKYYSISPYAYVANNPINAIDPRGDSIWFTIENNVATMHVTGKVINRSSSGINVNKLAKNISSGITDALGTSITIDGKEYEMQTDIQITGVESMDDVADSDHLFVAADNSDWKIFGATNELGGKVMHLNESNINGYFSYKTKTPVHEFGHTLGLEHPDPNSIGYTSTDIMNQGLTGKKFSGGSVSRAYDNWKAKSLNKGFNSIRTADGRKIPYPVLKDGRQIRTIHQLGFRYKY
ncbi:RHS repeat-associated core domain-containing protein, partial [Dysgonomonas sp. Marseille-P4677]|uniref:RHS repeat-associated core domain-containing protein n=1 Tax=Dysgonomonas sp. Marseille-P4677 TaxID=2364790 RepID=UPI002714C59E